MMHMKSDGWKIVSLSFLIGFVAAASVILAVGVAEAQYRPVEEIPPKGYSWPQVTEFTTKDGKHCVLAVFPGGKWAPPTVSLDCTWARPSVEPAEYSL